LSGGYSDHLIIFMSYLAPPDILKGSNQWRWLRLMLIDWVPSIVLRLQIHVSAQLAKQEAEQQIMASKVK